MSGTITGTIGRTSLSLPALAIGPTTGISFLVGGVNIGRRTWRRTVVESRFVAGEYEVDAVLDQTRDPQFRFRLRAANEAALGTAISTLVDAVEQPTWDLVLTVGGVAWPTVTFTRADTEIAFDLAHARSLVATVTVYTTRNPNASGPI